MFKSKWKRRYVEIANSIIAQDRLKPDNHAGDREFRQSMRFTAEEMLMFVEYGNTYGKASSAPKQQ